MAAMARTDPDSDSNFIRFAVDGLWECGGRQVRGCRCESHRH